MHEPLDNQKPHSHRRKPTMRVSFVFNMKAYEGPEFQTAALAKFMAEKVDQYFKDQMDYEVEISD